MKVCKHCGVDLSENKGLGHQCYVCKNGLERYGLNRNNMIEMLEAQNGCCYLCSKPVKLFDSRKGDSGYVDHCHTSGKVRSILCHPCNTSLGYIERNLDLKKLQEYINC